MGMYGHFPGSLESWTFFPQLPGNAVKSLPQVVTSACWDKHAGQSHSSLHHSTCKGQDSYRCYLMLRPKPGTCVYTIPFPGLAWKPFPSVDVTSINWDNSTCHFHLCMLLIYGQMAYNWRPVEQNGRGVCVEEMLP